MRKITTILLLKPEFSCNLVLHNQFFTIRILSHILFFVIILYQNGIGQFHSVETPFIQSFPKEIYNAGLHNWKINQDQQGIMYFANDGGLLTYDGTIWKTFTSPNKTTFRSLAINNRGIIYGGGQNEFGNFLPDTTGAWVFHSLKSIIPKEHREFEDVWEMFCINETIYFRSSGKLYEYKDDIVKVYDTLNIDFSGVHREQLFVHDINKGLFVLKNNGYQSMNNSESLKGKRVQGIVILNSDTLIATRSDGIYHRSQNKTTLWDNEAHQFLLENEIRSFIQLDEETIAIGTLFGGLVILNTEGKISQIINKENGLLSNRIFSVFMDRDKNVWLGLDKGINHLQINSSLSHILPDGQLEGTGYVAHIHNEQLYLGTNNGLYTTPWKKNGKSKLSQPFTLVNGTKGQAWGLNIIDNELILSNKKGAFSVSKNNSTQFTNNLGHWLFKDLDSELGLIAAGTYEGISLFKKEKGSLKYVQNISEMEESSRFIEIDKFGNIWMAHPYKGIYKLSKGNNYTDSKAQLLGQEQGLPSNIHNHLFKIKDEIIFCGEYGTFNYDYTNNQFEPNIKFNEIFGKDTKIRRLVETPNGNIWFLTNTEIGVLEIDDLGLDKKIVKKVFPELKDLLNGGFELIYPYSDEHVFISSEKGFYHYSSNENTQMDTTFQTIINEVSIFSPHKEIIFNGNTYDGHKITAHHQYTHTLPHSSNGFTFSYSATNFTHKKLLNYRYRLNGFDEEWSSWSNQNMKEYTNLPHGEYTFQVQAKSYQGIESNICEYSFNISPPWYLSTWAYIVYGFLFIGLALFIYQLSNKRYQNLEEDHEKIIQKNKEEINRLKSEKMKLELEHKKRALVSSTLLLVQKNETLGGVKEDLTLLTKEIKDKPLRSKINKLIHKLQQDEVLDDGWEQFMLHFNQLHGNFFQRLKTSYPTLTPKDLKLCGYLRMNLSTKEIASLMNISVRGVEASRYRLRKKIELHSSTNLTEFLMEY